MNARSFAPADLSPAVAPLGVGLAFLIALDQVTQLGGALNGYDPGVPGWRMRVAMEYESRVPLLLLATFLGLFSFAVMRPSHQRAVRRRVVLIPFVVLTALSVWAIAVISLDGARVQWSLSAEELPRVIRTRIRLLVGGLVGVSAVLAIGWRFLRSEGERTETETVKGLSV